MRNELVELAPPPTVQHVELTGENWLGLWKAAGKPVTKIIDYGRLREFSWSTTLVFEASELILYTLGFDGE
jgi:hypothetical protein